MTENTLSVGIHNPGNTYPINDLYVYLSIDQNGNEGVMGGINPNGSAFTLCFGTEQRAMEFRTIVAQICEAGKMKARLCKFTTKEVLEEIG